MVRGRVDPDWDGSLGVLALLLGLRWAEASDAAAALPAVPPDDDAAWWLRRAVTLWAASGDPGPASPLADGLEGGPAADSALGRLAAHLLVEAVLAHARLDLASGAGRPVRRGAGRAARAGRPAHPFSAMSAVCRARVLAFRGDIAAADTELRALRTVPSGRVGAVVSGTVALVRGNDADPAEVRRAVAAVDREVPAPDDLLSCGAHLLAAFGEIALTRWWPRPAGCWSRAATRG